MWIKTAAGSAVVVLTLVAVYFVSRLDDFLISEVKVEGASIVNAESVKKITDDELTGTYGILIPHSNALFAPKNEIEKSILASFPEVKSVSISDFGFQTLIVKVEERVTAAAWCAGQDVSKSDCYAMDENGFIFMKLASADGYVRYFGAVDSEPLGNTFLAGDFNTLTAFVGETVRSINRAADSVVIESDNDATLAFVGGGELRFVITEDTQATLENIASVFASQSFKTKRDFEYADFRYGNKVYVKFKGE
jgi:cell division septal protein FtsQ